MRNLFTVVRIAVALLVLPLPAFLPAQSAAPMPAASTAAIVEITAEPSHLLIAESDYARWFLVQIAPQAATLTHRHVRDFFSVILGAAEVENQVAGGSTATIKFADGEVRFQPGGFAHAVRNLSPTPFYNVTIELKQNGAALPNADTLPHQIAPGVIRRLVMVNDGVRVTEMRLAPGAMLPMHRHNNPHLVVALNEMQLLSTTANGSTAIRQQAGDAAWVKAGLTHSLLNSSANEGRFLTFEWQ